MRVSSLAGVTVLRFAAHVVVVVLLLGSTTFGQTPDDEAHRLSRELMSPFCPGRTLADCPSPHARLVRDEIEARLEKGETAIAIEQDLVLRYGAEIRGTPPAKGFAMVLWIVLPLSAGLGLIVLAMTVSRSVHRARELPSEDRTHAYEASTALNERLDAELVELE
jgi:cytochrome c-type biogenesis protein CcmH/NrfF